VSADKKKAAGASPTSENRKARYSYDILETLETGVVLVGSEVKAIRAGNVSLREAYARVRAGEVWLVNMYIPPYKSASYYNHDTRRERKLLVNRKEIQHLEAQLGKGGLALVPLKMYFTRGRVKILLGLGQGKKAWDKRRAIAERESKVQLARYTRR
jgi:SsrA-binding protein